MNNNSYTDLEHLQLVAGRIAQGGIDITSEYEDWLKITFACAGLGEAAREPYHDICRFYPGYTRQECDQKFDNCLRTGRGDITLGTLMELAKRHGIDVSLPKGRRPKSEEQKAEEEKDRFKQICEWLNAHYEFRFNTISEQNEVRARSPEEEEWKEMDDRQLNSLLTELHADKVLVSKANLETYIGSETFSPAYNPVVAYAEGLKPWNTRQKDYIDELFAHLGLAKCEEAEFLMRMAKKWYVAMVKVATGQEMTNQIMLILSGEREGTGKTFFVECFLPRTLRCYLHRVVDLSRYKDKDELLTLARNIVCFIDEIQINPSILNKLKNYVGGGAASAITERTHYAHFAVSRKVHASWIATTNNEVFLPESTGDRRFVVLPIAERGRDYKTLPQERAFAQAYYLATHPKAYDAGVTEDEIAKLKEINQKYVSQDLCTTLIPTVLRKPEGGEEAQAVTTGEIINWLTQKAGPNREFTDSKIGKAMKKLGFEPRRTNKGMRYIVVRKTMVELELENKRLAKQEVMPELPLEL